MAVLVHPAKPDMIAQRESVILPLPQLVAGLVQILGKKITAYIGSAKDTRTVDRWMSNGESFTPYKGVEERLRAAFHVAKMLSGQESDRVIQSWFTGLNPELDDRSPSRVLREADIQRGGPEVLRAARAFLAGG
ncbi:MAG TPA: DUF2384 domain-containing protein [Candidatus Angelobacter sp.]|nr:DUF2384 domain-containing protein [Candidatus Angelobacter sp.]